MSIQFSRGRKQAQEDVVKFLDEVQLNRARSQQQHQPSTATEHKVEESKAQQAVQQPQQSLPSEASSTIVSGNNAGSFPAKTDASAVESKKSPNTHS